METNNETVEQVAGIIREGMMCKFESYEEAYNRILSAHNWAMAAKDAEIERLTNIKKEYINLQAHVAALRREVTLKQNQNIEQGHQHRSEVKSLRALVGELADALSGIAHEGCGLGLSREDLHKEVCPECQFNNVGCYGRQCYELIAKARGVCNNV